MITSPSPRTASAPGVTSNVPSGLRNATITASRHVPNPQFADRLAGLAALTGHLDLLEAHVGQRAACGRDDVEEVGDLGLDDQVGEVQAGVGVSCTTRFAPARTIFLAADSSEARATITRSGRWARAESVM